MGHKRHRKLRRMLGRHKLPLDVVAKRSRQPSMLFPDEEGSNEVTSLYILDSPTPRFGSTEQPNSTEPDIWTITEIDTSFFKNENGPSLDSHQPYDESTLELSQTDLKDSLQTRCTDAIPESPNLDLDEPLTVNSLTIGKSDDNSSEVSVYLPFEMPAHLSQSPGIYQTSDPVPGGTDRSLFKRAHDVLGRVSNGCRRMGGMAKPQSPAATANDIPQLIRPGDNDLPSYSNPAITGDNGFLTKPFSMVEDHSPSSGRQEHPERGRSDGPPNYPAMWKDGRASVLQYLQTPSEKPTTSLPEPSPIISRPFSLPLTSSTTNSPSTTRLSASSTPEDQPYSQYQPLSDGIEDALVPATADEPSPEHGKAVPRPVSHQDEFNNELRQTLRHNTGPVPPPPSLLEKQGRTRFGKLAPSSLPVHESLDDQNTKPSKSRRTHTIPSEISGTIKGSHPGSTSTGRSHVSNKEPRSNSKPEKGSSTSAIPREKEAKNEPGATGRRDKRGPRHNEPNIPPRVKSLRSQGASFPEEEEEPASPPGAPEPKEADSVRHQKPSAAKPSLPDSAQHRELPGTQKNMAPPVRMTVSGYAAAAADPRDLQKGGNPEAVLDRHLIKDGIGFSPDSRQPSGKVQHGPEINKQGEGNSPKTLSEIGKPKTEPMTDQHGDKGHEHRGGNEEGAMSHPPSHLGKNKVTRDSELPVDGPAIDMTVSPRNKGAFPSPDTASRHDRLATDSPVNHSTPTADKSPTAPRILVQNPSQITDQSYNFASGMETDVTRQGPVEAQNRTNIPDQGPAKTEKHYPSIVTFPKAKTAHDDHHKRDDPPKNGDDFVPHAPLPVESDAPVPEGESLESTVAPHLPGKGTGLPIDPRATGLGGKEATNLQPYEDVDRPQPHPEHDEESRLEQQNGRHQWHQLEQQQGRQHGRQQEQQREREQKQRQQEQVNQQKREREKQEKGRQKEQQNDEPQKHQQQRQQDQQQRQQDQKWDKQQGQQQQQQQQQQQKRRRQEQPHKGQPQEDCGEEGNGFEPATGEPPSAHALHATTQPAVEMDNRKPHDPLPTPATSQEDATEEVPKQNDVFEADAAPNSSLGEDMGDLESELEEATTETEEGKRLVKNPLEQQDGFEAEAGQLQAMRNTICNLRSELDRARSEVEQYRKDREDEAKERLAESRKAADKMKTLKEDMNRPKAELRFAQAVVTKEAAKVQEREAQIVEQAVALATAGFGKKILDLEEKARKAIIESEQAQQDGKEKRAAHQDQLSLLEKRLATAVGRCEEQQVELNTQRDAASALQKENLRLQREIEEATSSAEKQPVDTHKSDDPPETPSPPSSPSTSQAPSPSTLPSSPPLPPFSSSPSSSSPSAATISRQHERQISELQAQNAAMSKAVQTNETKQRDLAEQISRLESELQRSKDENHTNQKDLDDERIAVAELTRILENVERNLAGVSTEKAELEQRSNRLGQELADAQQKAADVRQSEAMQDGASQDMPKELDRLRSEVGRLTGLLEQKSKELFEARDTAASLRQAGAAKAEKHDDLENKMAKLRLETETTRSEIHRVTGQLKEKERELAEAMDAAAKLRQTGTAESVRHHNLEKEVERLGLEAQQARSENSKLTSELEHLGKELTRARDEAADLRKDWAGEAEKYTDLEKKLERLGLEAQHARLENSKLIGQLEQRTKELTEAQHEAAEGRRKRAIDAESARALQREVDSLRSRADGFQSEVSKLTGQLEQKRKELAQAQNAIAANKAAEDEKNRSLHDELNSLRSKANEARLEIGQLTARLEHQGKQLADSARANDDLARELSELTQQREYEAKSSRDKISDLTAKVERKEKELERASQLASELERQEEQTRQRLEDCENKKLGLAGQLEQQKEEHEDAIIRERSLRQSAEQRQSVLHTELQGLKSQVKDLRDGEQSAKTSFQELSKASKMEQKRLIQQLEESVDRAGALEKEVESLGRQLQEAHVGAQTLEEANSQRQELEVSLNHLQGELERSNDESKRLKKQLQERESALNKELERLRSQLGHSRNVISNQEAKLIQSDKRHHELENQISTLTTRLQAEVQLRRNEAARLQTLLSNAQRDADAERKRADGMTGQLQQLKEVSESMKSQLETQRRQILDKQSDLETFRTEAAKLATAKTKLEASAESDKKTIESLKATNQALASGVRDGANRQLVTQIEQSREEVKQLDKKLKDQESVLKAQGAFIAKAQAAAWDRIKQAAKEKSIVIDDDELVAKFQIDVESRAQQWAEKYAVKASELRWAQDAIRVMGKELKKVTGMVQRDPSAFCRRYDSDLVVHALLSRFVADHILGNPFLVFELQAGADFAGLMTKMYQAKLKADPPAAHKWRYSQLLWLGASSQSNPAKPSPSAVPDVLRPSDPRNTTYLSNLANQFVNSPAKILLNELAFSTSGIQTIICILRNAAEAAFLMWRQPMEIQIREFDQLKALQYPLPEDGSGVAETHRRQTGPVAMAARRRDAVVDVVVQPAIVAKQENGAEKVWSRGVVLWN